MSRDNTLEGRNPKKPGKAKITVSVSKQGARATTEVVSGRRDQVLHLTDKPVTRTDVTEDAALQGQELPHVGVAFADPDGDGHLGLNGELEGDGPDADGWETEVEENETTLARVVQVKRYYNKVNGYRSRQERNAMLQEAWSSVIPSLVDAYLAWKARDTADLPPDVLKPSDSPAVFKIDVFEIYDKARQHTFARKDIDEAAVLTMMRHGYIASTPTAPAFGVGMRTLELYRQLRLHQPRFGFQPFARALAALSNIPYRTELRRQISDSFDVYLAIRREVSKRVDALLGRDTPNWRALYACPPCGYKLEAEPALAVARLWAMDGNGSLKRHAAAGGADTRVFASDYFLENADEYKDEVRKQSSSKKSKKFVVGAEPGDGGDTSDPPPCVDNWKNMQPEHMKHQLDFFEQTGVFLGACRHGFILFILEMIRSGELAKYPLALVAKMLQIIDAIQRSGYDIGCGFRSTLARSKLGALARAAKFDTLTNAFHGHAHHRLCQLRNHPLVTTGVGLEDFETCERVFSASNEVARTIRFATRFHYRQYIDMHYRFWDEQKYAELSKFIVDNYTQALNVIKQGKTAIQLAQSLGYSAADFVKWREEELAYLEGLKKEPEGDVLSIGYVESLMRLANAQSIASAADAQFNAYRYTGTTAAQLQAYHAHLTQLDRRKNDADRDVEAAERIVRGYEEKLQIVSGRRWTPEYREWQGTLIYIFQRNFRRALDKLERLVVQRLFELTKANMSGTSYKLRQQIAKALQRRSRAIQNALKAFNDAHKKLDPDAVTLTWKTIAEWTELSDFSLLRMARRDIRREPWANIANREFMVAYFKKLRAEEEIVRCNVEARRLRTWIDDEDRQLARAVQTAEADNDLIAVALRELHDHRARTNHIHRIRLQMLEKMDGFTGTPGPGTRLGSSPPPAPAPAPAPAPTSQPLPPPLPLNTIELTDDDAEGSDDDAFLDQAERLEELEVAAAGDSDLPFSFFS